MADLWIITRESRGEKRYRAPSGRLVMEREAAKIYECVNIALDAAHEGDIIEPWALPVQRPISEGGCL